MNRNLKTILIIGIFFCGIIAIAYYAFIQIDFIGQKDQKIVEENLKRSKNTLLSAAYRNGTDYCMVELLDSVNMEIKVGDKSGGLIIAEEYKISNDTIFITKETEHARKYINSNKLLIKDNKLLFKISPSGIYDTAIAMTIEFNKLKL